MFKRARTLPPIPLPRRRKSRPFPFILLGVTLFSVWLVWSSLTPKLPKPSEPPRFYSSQAYVDLRLALITAIQKAERSIHLVMFGLSDPSILSALSKKVRQLIPVTIYYDSSGSPDIKKILGKGDIHPIRNSGLMHQKILILDDQTVFIGSANFTTASLKMHDNLVLGFLNPKVARFLKTRAPHSAGNLRTMVGGQDLEVWLLPDPRGHALTEIRKKLRIASRSIHLALFTFTHKGLADELIRAHKRGVKVSLAIDLYSGLGASAKIVEYLKSAGVKVLFSQGTALLHHKMALIDEQTLIMGSANWTKAAFTKNSDCLLFLYNLNFDQKNFLSRLWYRIEQEAKPA